MKKVTIHYISGYEDKLQYKIKQGKVKVAYCTKEKTLAEFLTKRLQDPPFRQMQYMILNFPSAKSQECTGVC